MMMLSVRSVSFCLFYFTPFVLPLHLNELCVVFFHFVRRRFCDACDASYIIMKRKKADDDDENDVMMYTLR